MLYFSDLNKQKKDQLFFQNPNEFNCSDKELLAHGLGAVLYIPGSKKHLSQAIEKTSASTVVVCLEDAVSDSQLKIAHRNVRTAFEELQLSSKNVNELPFIFVRGRNQEHFKYISIEFEQFKDLIFGFVLPKFEFKTGIKHLEFFDKLKEIWQKDIYLMPILESLSILDPASRYSELTYLNEIFDCYREHILNIRIGATDIAGLLGLRRSMVSTIWDNSVLQSVLADIINCFGRQGNDYVLSGPVWEYFETEKYKTVKMFTSPEIRGLLKEIEKDQINGLWGKTVIHPTQILPVLSKMVISYQDYTDASAILTSDGGVSAGVCSSRMNEVKPHRFWAEKIMKRSKIFGVFNDGMNSEHLLRTYVDKHENRVLPREFYTNYKLNPKEL